MFIQTEATPNPATLKFLPGTPVLEVGTAEFTSPESASLSPLAEMLLGIDGVVAVYYGRDFISVTKRDDKEWLLLKPPILGAIMDHFVSGRPLMLPQASLSSGHAETEGDESEVVRQIKELLDTRVRPAVARDGGDITFVRFEEGVVWLSMRGACSGCPSSTATLKHGIENMLRHYIPEVQEVRAA